MNTDITDNPLWESVTAKVMIDSSGIIVAVNRSLLELSKYVLDNVIGKPIHMLMAEKYRKKHGQHLKMYFNNPVERDMGSALDIELRNSDGDGVAVLIFIKPFEKDGKTYGIAELTDISHQKRLQADVEEQSDTIQGINERLQAELSQEKEERNEETKLRIQADSQRSQDRARIILVSTMLVLFFLVFVGVVLLALFTDVNTDVLLGSLVQGVTSGFGFMVFFYFQAQSKKDDESLPARASE